MEKENKTGIQELKNEAVEEAMKAFLADKTNQTMANLMAVMRDARFLVPADFPPDVKKQVIEKAKRGEKCRYQDSTAYASDHCTESEWGALCTGIYIHRTDENKCQISGNSECDH